MLRTAKLCLALGMLLAVGLDRWAQAAEVQQTAIYVGDMHCKECARKIASRLYTVPGVVGVRASVQRNAAYVTPQTGKQPSPRALWEAIEAVDFKPVKLIGPTGTFTKKPNF